MHSVVSSFRYQLPDLPEITLNYVATALSHETISNSEYYLPYIEDLSMPALRRGLITYTLLISSSINHSVTWSHDFGKCVASVNYCL